MIRLGPQFKGCREAGGSILPHNDPVAPLVLTTSNLKNGCARSGLTAVSQSGWGPKPPKSRGPHGCPCVVHAGVVSIILARVGFSPIAHAEYHLLVYNWHFCSKSLVIYSTHRVSIADANLIDWSIHQTRYVLYCIIYQCFCITM